MANIISCSYCLRYIMSNTGSQAGLQLRLNIEQYEYMKGPNTGAGLKLHVHNQGDVALVKDHGIAVAPGAHAFVGVNIIKVSWSTKWANVNTGLASSDESPKQSKMLITLAAHCQLAALQYNYIIIGCIVSTDLDPCPMSRVDK